METEDITRDQAAEALATVEECRGIVRVEWDKRRGRRYELMAFGALTPLVVYPSKDLIRSRARRWTLVAGWHLASYALGAAIQRRKPVMARMPRLSPGSLKRTSGIAFATIAGLAVAERVVVLLLRRSRLRWPNVVAGFVVAVLRTGYRSTLLERALYGDKPGDEPAASDARLHRALLLPDTLRVAALLGEGEIVDLAFIRDTFGIDRLDLAEDLQPLYEDKLVASVAGRDTVRVYLTPDGRDAFDRHMLALRDRVSTGDTPR